MVNGAKNWVFTLNNYTEQDESRLRELGSNEDEYRYFIFGRELGESGTRHLQGSFCLRRKRTLRHLRDSLSNQAHFEVMRGTPSQAAEYCKKEGDFEEFGDLPQRGRGGRSDLSDLFAAIRRGDSKSLVIEEHFAAYSRATRAANEAFIMFAPVRCWMPLTYVYWGETGTGKTRRAFHEAGSDPYMHPGGRWFDGYSGQSSVIFDDFGGSEFKLTYLLKLLDRYPMRVPIKGGFVNWAPRRIFITSNYPVNEWFPNAKDEHRKALLRRIHKRVRFRRLASCVQELDQDDEEINVV